ncbi:MAG: rRNA maturation RNase YbeY [Acidobacteriota bacterium]
MKAAPLAVAVQNPQGYRDVRKRALELWLRKVVLSLAPQAGSLAARLTSDAEVQRLNRRFRSKDKPTDVLSFPGETTADGYHVGDIVISVPTARRQAAEAEHSAERELKVLLLHGLLHCLGYDHETDDGKMERRERFLRRKWIGDD